MDHHTHTGHQRNASSSNSGTDEHGSGSGKERSFAPLAAASLVNHNRMKLPTIKELKCSNDINNNSQNLDENGLSKDQHNDLQEKLSSMASTMATEFALIQKKLDDLCSCLMDPTKSNGAAPAVVVSNTMALYLRHIESKVDFLVDNVQTRESGVVMSELEALEARMFLKFDQTTSSIDKLVAAVHQGLVASQPDNFVEAVLERCFRPNGVSHWESKKPSANGPPPAAFTKDASGLSISDFQVGRPLGKGAFGMVVLARYKKNKKVVCLKAFRKQKVNASVDHYILREADIQRQLNHPNIVRFLGMFDDVRTRCLVLEYVPGGDLRSMLDAATERCLPPDKAAKYILDVANALEYLQIKNIMHRDLKPDNLLMGADKSIKIADFGVSAVVSDLSAQAPSSICGTLGYQAPEMIVGLTYDCRVDVWSLGVMLYEFLYGVTPFYHEDPSVTELYTVKYSANFHEMKPMPPQAIALMSELLKNDAKARLPVTWVKQNPWILNPNV